MLERSIGKSINLGLGCCFSWLSLSLLLFGHTRVRVVSPSFTLVSPIFACSGSAVTCVSSLLFLLFAASVLQGQSFRDNVLGYKLWLFAPPIQVRACRLLLLLTCIESQLTFLISCSPQLWSHHQRWDDIVERCAPLWCSKQGLRFLHVEFNVWDRHQLLFMDPTLGSFLFLLAVVHQEWRLGSQMDGKFPSRLIAWLLQTSPPLTLLPFASLLDSLSHIHYWGQMAKGWRIPCWSIFAWRGGDSFMHLHRGHGCASQWSHFDDEHQPHRR